MKQANIQTFNAVPTLATPLLHHIEQVSEGWINKYLLTYKMPDDSLFTYESVSRKKLDAYTRQLRRDSTTPPTPDAISLVGRTVDDELLLIREFRYPLNSWCIAFPAGLVEPGEDLAACAERELLEETGYGLRSLNGKPCIRPLKQPGYSSTGMSEESVHTVFAEVEKRGNAQPESLEFIEVFTLPISDIGTFLEENTLPIGTRCQLVLEGLSHTR
ncbi:MAG: NUDIX hydrolase [Raoultibacter sp.]